jgi:hypothetical protein
MYDLLRMSLALAPAPTRTGYWLYDEPTYRPRSVRAGFHRKRYSYTVHGNESNYATMTEKKGNTGSQDRGCILTGMLILIALHGVGAAYLIFHFRADRDPGALAWMALVLFALAIADIVAAAAIWFWKKWGLRLYAISTAIGIAAGLILTASQLVVFHDIVPLAVLGYIIKDRWSDFD